MEDQEDESYEIEGPSDWPVEFSDLKKLDSLLRCSICFDYFNIAVIVPLCSHNYCSLCIRKHVMYKKCCPSCNKELDDLELRPNRVLDELVQYFRSIRKKLLTLCSPKHDNKICQRDDDVVFEHSIKYRNPNNKKSPKEDEPTTSRTLHDTKSDLKALDCEIDKVDCPVCGCKVSKKGINIHLDACLNGNKRPKRHLSNSFEEDARQYNKKMTTGKGLLGRRKMGSIKVETGNTMISSSINKSRNSLPKMCCDVMSDKQLRAKLKSFNLPTKGDKKIMIKRLKSYCLLYNAECDAANPMTAKEVADQIINQEKNLSNNGYIPKTLVPTHDHTLTICQKSELAEEHSKLYNEQFNELVKEVKNRTTTEQNTTMEQRKTDTIKTEGQLFEKGFNFTIISPDKARVTNPKHAHLKQEDQMDEEFVFEKTKIIVDKKAVGNAKRRLNKNKPGNKTLNKKNDNKGKKNVSCIDSYFSKAKMKSKKNVSCSAAIGNNVKVESKLLVIDSDSPTDTEEEVDITIRVSESPEIVPVNHFNSTAINAGNGNGNSPCNVSIGEVSPISSRMGNDHYKGRKKCKGSFSLDTLEPKALQNAFAVQTDKYLDKGVNDIDSNDLSLEGHISELVDKVFSKTCVSDDPDETLSDAEIVPDPPSEADFTCTESEIF